jgi:predicted amidophosphoribosyltransferase
MRNSYWQCPFCCKFTETNEERCKECGAPRQKQIHTTDWECIDGIWDNPYEEDYGPEWADQFDRLNKSGRYREIKPFPQLPEIIALIASIMCLTPVILYYIL